MFRSEVYPPKNCWPLDWVSFIFFRISLGRGVLPSRKIAINLHRTSAKLHWKVEPYRLSGLRDPSVQIDRQTDRFYFIVRIIQVLIIVLVLIMAIIVNVSGSISRKCIAY